MYLKVVSDLHLEFGLPFFPTPDVRDAETVLVLAGDINLGKNIHATLGHIIQNTKYLAYIYLPGNHEYYNDNITRVNYHLEWCQKEFAKDHDNVHIFTEFGSVKIGNAVFMGGTMWTDGGKTKKERELLAPFMNDFRIIRYDTEYYEERLFSVSEMIKRFIKFTDSLCDALEKIEDEQVVLLTHHMPDYQCIDPQYQFSSINGGFAVDLINYVPSSLMNKIDVMCFGHTHTQFIKRIQIQGCDHLTQMICNPRGYPRKLLIDGQRTFECSNFDDTILFDLQEKVFE